MVQTATRMLLREHGQLSRLGTERGTSELFRVSVAGGWTVRAQVLRLGCGAVGELFEGGAKDA
jgi:hypothetical protein